MSALPLSAHGSDHLYVITDSGTGCVKVGRSVDPDARLGALQTGCPSRLQIDGVVKWAGFLEPLFHALLGHERTTGEWYPPGSLAVAVLAAWEKEGNDFASNLIAFGHALRTALIARGLIDGDIIADPEWLSETSPPALRELLARAERRMEWYGSRVAAIREACQGEAA